MNDISLREEINILEDSNLTPTELFIIRLLFLAQDGDSDLLNAYLSNVSNGKEVFLKVLESLQEKGIILKSFSLPEKGKELRYKDVPLNKNFLRKWIRESHALGKEFFEAYPPFIYINGKMVSIKNITKAGLFGIEDFCIFYAKKIKLSEVTHERIMEDLRYAVDHDLIRYSILEFLASEKWKEIEYLRDSGEVAGYNNTELW